MNKIHVNALNHKISKNAEEFVAHCDNMYEKKLENVVESIAAEYREKPIILLAGPSGSGKTTSAFKLDEMLEKRGICTHTISMDNYFLPKSKFADAIGEDGKVDYESPYRIDIPKLNKHMQLISECEEIVIPQFEFATQTSADGCSYKRGKDEIVIFEGIHALNPLVTGAAGDFASCMYVSVRTRIELGNGDLFHPCFIRLMRRLIRDGNFRGRDVSETLDLFDSVENGESKYIMPFKHRAEYSVDTFIPYEPAVYRNLLLDKLEETSKTYENFERFESMVRVLSELDPISLDIIPKNSLVREFIGGSSYEY